MIEAGQADLLLISWLGVDLLTAASASTACSAASSPTTASCRGRATRSATTSTSTATRARATSGCSSSTTTAASAASSALTVRNGQAGFFTDEELRESGGVLWDRGRRTARPRDGRVDPPRVRVRAPELHGRAGERLRRGAGRRLLRPRLRARAHARAHAEDPGRPHAVCSTRSTHFEPAAGPGAAATCARSWRSRPTTGSSPGTSRTTLHARHADVRGLPAGDGVLPGGARATRSTATAGASSPCPTSAYRLRCRGQVMPSSTRGRLRGLRRRGRRGPTPTLFADLLGTVDGLKAFHCGRMGLRLVPDWPLDAGRRPMPPRALAADRRGAARGRRRLRVRPRVAPRLRVGPARRRPSGRMYAALRRQARASRACRGRRTTSCRASARVDGPIGGMQAGSLVEVASTTCPSDAWYFERERRARMPLRRAARGRAPAVRLARLLRRQRAHAAGGPRASATSTARRPCDARFAATSARSTVASDAHVSSRRPAA